MSAKELMGLTFPDPIDIVPGVIPEGGILLVGSPKLGKTLLMLNIALAISSGGLALGTSKVDQGNVLYLALEDGQKRTQKRLGQMLNGANIPSDLDFVWKCPPIGNGAEELIERWIKSVDNPRLIVVDTIKRIRPESKTTKTQYESDYESFAPLTDLSHCYHVSLTGTHHDRKMADPDVLNTVSGTHGLTGSCDTVLVLQRTRAQREGVLWAISRDGEDRKKALVLEYPHWRLVGDADWEYMLTPERKDIYDIVRGICKPVGPTEVAKMISKPVGSVKLLMWKMSTDGQLSAKDGKYSTIDYTTEPAPYIYNPNHDNHEP